MELRDLVKAFVWKRNCETSSRTRFIYCVTSKPQYFSCAEVELCQLRAPGHRLFCMRKRNCGILSLSRGGTSRQRIVHVWKRNCRTPSHIIVCVRKRNFKSHNSLYVESLWFLMQKSEVPWNAGPKAPVSKPSWRCCSQLCHLRGGPYWDFLVCSILIKHDRISWRVTRIQTLGKHHDRRPQGQSFLKGQYVETKVTS